VRVRSCIASVLIVLCSRTAMASGCGASEGVWVQVLGTANPQGQESSSYLIWLDGKARALVDTGAGSAVNFAASGASVADLDVILLSRLHINQAGDLPGVIQLSLAQKRSRPLLIYGPNRSKFMPSTVTFVRTLFDTKRGVYRYLGELLNPLSKDPYKLQPQDIEIKPRSVSTVYRNERLQITATVLTAEPIAALAWGVRAAGKLMVFSTHTIPDKDTLSRLSRRADLLVIPDNTRAGPPLSALGGMASELGVKKLVFTDYSSASMEQEQQLQLAISEHYRGYVIFAEPLGCLVP
jgi:ribonuclease BN (tRNA processing enzyme)